MFQQEGLPDDYDGLVGVARAAAQLESSRLALTDELVSALRDALPYVAQHESEHMSNVALAVVDKCRLAIARAEVRP